MSIRVWERKRADLAPYRPRRVETTPLYRIVYQEREQLEWQWEAQFQSTYGALGPEVLAALDGYLDCGILAHGCARAECENQECRHSMVIPYSCKKRGICPSCSAKRALIFAEHLHREVLEKVPHRHVVLSLPKRLRPFLKYDRTLNDVLLKAAWESLSEMFQAALPQGRPGAVLTVQTARESLNFNSHIHGICSDGVFDASGNFHPLGSLNTEKLATLFCHKVLKALQERGLIADSAVAQILSQKHSGFSAWWGEEIPPGDEGYRLFLARYIDRGPIVGSRIEIDSDVITYRTEKDQLTHEFSPLEFLARITPHIPNKWESTVRYYAHYSHRARGARKKRAVLHSPPVILPLPADQQRKSSRAWAALIKRVFEVEPLLCPKCGSRMKIKSFITNPHEVKRLLDNLGIPPFIKPLPISAVGPPEAELLYSQATLAA